MGIFFGGHTPKHRVYDYKPRYYDEQKERAAELRARAEAAKNGETYKDDKYYPGKYTRGKMRDAVYNSRRKSLKTSTTRIISMISLVVLLYLIYLFAQNFSYMFA